MKKIVASLLIILVILNSYIPSTQATDSTGKAYNALIEGEGELEYKTGETDDGIAGTISRQTETNGNNNKFSIITALLEVFAILPKMVNWVMSEIALHGEINYIDAKQKTYSIYTIQEMLLGKFYIFDINFFDTSETDDENAEIINTLKENVAIWYATMRNIALVGSALIIIYVGIRLALAITSKGPAEIAKYQKMLMSWLVGFILIFFIQYIIIVLLYICKIFTNFIFSVIPKGTSESNMEQIILTDQWNKIEGQKGINKLIPVILYYVLVYYQAKFFIIYLKRVLETFFLMIISPLVCMLYPIDNIGDGRSQSFSVWFKKIVGNIIMQPIHLSIYTVFIFTASELATEMPLIAVVFFATLSNGEKIIKALFGLNGIGLKDVNINHRIRLPRFRR